MAIHVGPNGARKVNETDAKAKAWQPKRADIMTANVGKKERAEAGKAKPAFNPFRCG
jgi:hypothetical protein